MADGVATAVTVAVAGGEGVAVREGVAVGLAVGMVATSVGTVVGERVEFALCTAGR